MQTLKEEDFYDDGGWISHNQLYTGLLILLICGAILLGFVMGAADLARACGL